MGSGQLLYITRKDMHIIQKRRWRGKQKALYLRYEQLVNEMFKRKFHHHSPLDVTFATGKKSQDVFVDSHEIQIHLLHQKKCGCTI